MNRTQRTEVTIVLAMAGLYFFSFIQRVGIPGAIFNDLQSELNIDAVVVARLGSIYLFVYAVMQPFVGLFADRWGGIRVALASGLLLVIGATLFPLSHDVAALYSSRVLVGLGASAMFLCLYKEADLAFSGRYFTVIVGILLLVGYCGGLAGTRPFRMLVDSGGWRTACLILAAGTAILLALTWWFGRKVERDFYPQVVGSPVRNMVAVLTNRLNYPLLISFSISVGVSLCLQMMIGQKFIEDFCGVTALEASGLTFVMMLFTMATLPVCGLVSDRFGNRRLPFLIFAAVATLTGVLLILVGIHCKMPPGYFLCAFIPPALCSGCAPVIQSMMKEQNPPDAVATSIGVANAATYVMIAIITQMAGQVMDLFNSQAVITTKARVYPPSAYVALFSILLALSLVALIASCFGHETSPSVIQANKLAGQPV